MKTFIALIFALAATGIAFAAELVRPEVLVHPVNKKCHENCSPLCGHLLRVRVWQQEDFNRLPQENAAFRCYVDKENFYVEVFVEDKDIICEAASPDAKLFNASDAIQIFLKSEKQTFLWEFNVTAGNVSNGFLYPGPGCQITAAAEKLSAKHEVKVDGTINDIKDNDRSWSVRVTIPLALLRRNGLNFRDSEAWTILVSRNNYGKHLRNREISTYPQMLRGDNDPARFARLVIPAVK